MRTLTDFADHQHWHDLARKHGVRLPAYSTMTSTASMKKYIKRCGLTVPQYLEWTGYKRLNDWTRLNPDWPLTAFVGLLLEWRDAKDRDGVPYEKKETGEKPSISTSEKRVLEPSGTGVVAGLTL